MTEAEKAERLERLAIDIDTRLTTLWLVITEPDSVLADAMGNDEGVRNALGACLRAAYSQGYSDALREDRVGRRAELALTHGYKPE